MIKESWQSCSDAIEGVCDSSKEIGSSMSRAIGQLAQSLGQSPQKQPQIHGSWHP